MSNSMYICWKDDPERPDHNHPDYEWVKLPPLRTHDELIRFHVSEEDIELHFLEGYWEEGKEYPLNIYVKLPRRKW